MASERSMPLTRATLATFTVALLAVTAVPRAQEPTPAPAPFGESVEVELVEVEVFVADARGRPVTGLTASDFALEVDGELRPIAGLYESNPRAELSTVTTPSAAPGEPATSAPAAPVASPPPPPPPERQLSLVVLLDELHLRPGGRKLTLDRIASMLEERLAAGDSV